MSIVAQSEGRFGNDMSSLCVGHLLGIKFFFWCAVLRNRG
ncbi:hypothetical protein PsAD2_04555 [Pseudovibrio axinellae]|uniref:Uncharacterized protein n=1 Tax=Pseudovibrio axinellae TaxID=989403 RepID=A0A165SXX0_9HYPH|nr:hypothetical protein PsAD2_04555 [Pseudovibrio axinellae]SER64455.1 hypothetical protein SAMN05421798_1158 [Pseudovibrio axinellae]